MKSPNNRGVRAPTSHLSWSFQYWDWVTTRAKAIGSSPQMHSKVLFLKTTPTLNSLNMERSTRTRTHNTKRRGLFHLQVPSEFQAAQRGRAVTVEWPLGEWPWGCVPETPHIMTDQEEKARSKLWVRNNLSRPAPRDLPTTKGSKVFLNSITNWRISPKTWSVGDT